ncbi:MAG: hypothetical protein M1818_002910 [Claussenomyces sp. TS43310]|nr:MAG: hypothetical protein M1818_002910 [Claussenomyces sp. TS43310]
MAKAAAETYLRALINKTLRITTSDRRMFLGEFKCTDSDRNIILSGTYEYRQPSKTVVDRAGEEGKDKVILEMTSRYLGLVVVPGEYIRRIEVEEFASQVRDGSRWVVGSDTPGALEQ